MKSLSQLGKWVWFAWILAVTQSPVFAKRRGVQAIGLSRWSQGDVGQLATELVAANRDSEVAYLPFEFTLNESAQTTPQKDPPFLRSWQLVQSVLSNQKFKGKLTLTTFLYFHNSNARDKYQSPFRWSAFATDSRGNFTQNTTADQQFRQMYKVRCERNARFLKSVQQWAQSNGHGNKLTLVTVPDLEDNIAEGGQIPSSKQLNDVKNFIANVYNSVALTTLYRRSSDRRTDGLPLEQHGAYSLIQGLPKGDVYSNDGTDISIANQTEFNRFLAASRTGVQRGVSILFWRQDYNGPRNSGKPPYERGILRPLTNSTSGTAETQALRRFLKDN